ncbi:MAG: HEAT repeat domain-containing protein [Bacillota bacterium]
MFGSKLSAVEKAVKKCNAGALIAMGSNKDKEVSLAAIAGLGSVGGQEACNYLISRLSSQEPEARIAAAHALGAIGDKHTKAFISAQMNKETDTAVREAMGLAMSRIKSY